MHNKSKTLLCLCAAAAPSAAIYAYAHRLMKERPLEMLYEKRAADKDFVPLSEIPERMVLFLLETEDPGFFRHPVHLSERTCHQRCHVGAGDVHSRASDPDFYFG